jgi:hypothetical protein
VIGNSSVNYCKYALDFQLAHGEVAIPVQAYVSPDLPYPMILGLSFLEQNEGVIHVAKRQLYLEDKADNLIIEQHPVDSFVYLAEDVHITPRSEICVKVYLNATLTEELFVMNYVTLNEATSTFTAKGILDPNECEFYVAPANFSHKVQSLPKITIVAQSVLMVHEEMIEELEDKSRV